MHTLVGMHLLVSVGGTLEVMSLSLNVRDSLESRALCFNPSCSSIELDQTR